MNKLFKGFTAVIIALTLSACGGGGSSSSEGSITLSIADAPIDGATAVTVNFIGVQLKPRNGPPIVIDLVDPATDDPLAIELMGLTGGVTDDLLTSYTIEPGEYIWVRLLVAEDAGSIDVEGGGNEPLTIPSGGTRGLQLNHDFTIAAGGITRFTIDFDLRKSVHVANNKYILRPTLRIVDNIEVGTLTGSVDNGLLVGGEGCRDEGGNVNAAIYVYSGAGVTPDDIFISDTEANTGPLTSVNVAEDGSFTVVFIEAGEYTVAVTCQVGMENPATDDTLVFEGVMDATVVAGETTELAPFMLILPPPPVPVPMPIL